LKYLKEIADHFESAAAVVRYKTLKAELQLTTTKVMDEGLRHDLGVSVWAIRLQSRCLWDRDSWRSSIDGCGGGIYDPSAFIFFHGLEKKRRAGNVVLIICQWDFHTPTALCAFGNEIRFLEKLKVEWTYRYVHSSPYTTFAVLLKNRANFVPPGKIGLVGLDLGAFYVMFREISRQLAPQQCGYPRQCVGMRVVAIIERDDLEASSFL
jgi:hypothetical protein